VQRVDARDVSPKPPVDKTFRAFDPGQGLLLPPSLDDWLPAEHLVRFIAELVDEHVDLSRIRAGYTEGRGGPPDDPRLMVRILLYGYTIGVRSSRAIEVRCTDDVAFRWLAAGAGPDYRAIARFRQRHLSALGHLFVQALALCQAAGMVRLGRVALDGTKVRANASKRKAMSYARMSEKEKVLADEVSALLAEAGRIDKAETAATSCPSSCGAGKRGWPRSARRRPRSRKRPRTRRGSGPKPRHATVVTTRTPPPPRAPPRRMRRRRNRRRSATLPTRTPKSCSPATGRFTSAITPRAWSMRTIR
jgi:transposase